MDALFEQKQVKPWLTNWQVKWACLINKTNKVEK